MEKEDEDDGCGNNIDNNGCFGATSENGIIIGNDNNNDSSNNNNTWVCSIPNSTVSLTIK